MMFKNIAATALMAGALGAFAFGVSAATAQADDHGYHGCGPLPCDVFQGPPGQNPIGPPGQVKKDQFLPVYGVPPGHWDEVGPPWGPWPY
jgi:hypothetical protein